jgi:hypothetical protein
MKYLRIPPTIRPQTFEGFQTESEVAKICDEYGIRNWTLNSEGLVDVNSSVNLDLDLVRHDKELTKLPLKFGEVTGYFSCDSNKLTSLEGSPHTVSGGFFCNHNQLTSLEGCPHTVGGNFSCGSNNLTSFEGVQKIGGNFNCNGNPLKSVWDLINPDDNKWNDQVMELFTDYDCIRGTDLIIDRFNDFLEEIGKSTVDKVGGYNNI